MGVEIMDVKRIDFKRFCRDNGIEIYYNPVNDEYIVESRGNEMTRKKTYLDCENYIYEVMIK